MSDREPGLGPRASRSPHPAPQPATGPRAEQPDAAEGAMAGQAERDAERPPAAEPGERQRQDGPAAAGPAEKPMAAAPQPAAREDTDRANPAPREATASEAAAAEATERQATEFEPTQLGTTGPKTSEPETTELAAGGLQAGGLAAEEEELRRLLREAVDGIEPAAGSLRHLQQAVPARRRRRRQMLLGAAAAVAVLGLGTPLVLSAAGGVVGGGAKTATGAHGDQASMGAGSGEAGPDDPRTAAPEAGDSVPDREDGDHSDRSPRGGEDGDPSSLAVSAPSCERAQLGAAQTSTQAPDAQGTVYGSIRLVNISDRPCRVTGGGELAALPLHRSTFALQVQVVERMPGDRATGLPTPDQTYEELVLPPGRAYEVRFAWVPDGTGSCVVDSHSGLSAQLGGAPAARSGESGTDPTPDSPDQGDSAGGTGESEGTTGDTGSSGEGDEGGSGDTGSSEPPEDEDSGDPGDPPGGDTAGDGSGGQDAEPQQGLLLRYTPAAGEPEAASIRLQGACAGTVYRTGVLQAPAA